VIFEKLLCRLWDLLFVAAVVTVGCSKADTHPEFDVESPAFNEGTMIPRRHTCDGEDVSPILSFFGYPEETTSFAIIMDDPDAPLETVTHWVIWNLPGKTNFVTEDQNENAGEGVGQGKNMLKNVGYSGPCPPPKHGPHRYFFKVYALDKMLQLKEGATKKALSSAMDGHIIGYGELLGVYDR